MGFRSYAMGQRILVIWSAASAPFRRAVAEAKTNGMCIDATSGRRTVCALVMDTGHVVLSASKAKTIAKHIDARDSDEVEV